MAEHGTYQFGPYRLEVATRRLFRGDELVPLTPKAFDTLTALIDRRDRVVDKSELMQVVWPDSFVEEANLSQTIFVLRKTLGGDADGRHYIETVPRRGYRFAADARMIETTPSVVATGAARWNRAILAAALVFLAIAAAFLAFRQRETAAEDPGISRIAVLPFENLSNNPEDEWLAGAFSVTLTAGLQQVESLVPVSRDRIVEWYQRLRIREGAAADAATIRAIASSLGVRYVVHGAFQRVDDRLRVTAQLVAAADGSVQAQETVTDDFRNLLKMQDDLTARFAARLDAGRRRALPATPPASLEAYQATIEGQNLYAVGRYHDAVGPLTRATSLDPKYAPAWAVLSKTLARLATISFISGGSADQQRRNALDYAARAIELSPELHDAHVALAVASRELEDVARWRTAASRAIELNPNVAEAHSLLADSYFAGNAFGCARDRDPERAERHYRIAIELDPQFAPPYSNWSYQLSWLGRESEALAMAERGLAATPGNPTLVRARAHTLVRLRRADDAEAAIRAMHAAGASLSAQDHVILGSIALVRGSDQVASREFETALARLPSGPFELAVVRAYLDNGRIQRGAAHLDQSIAREPTCLAFSEWVPALAPYRSRPEWTAVMTKWRGRGAVP